MTNEKQSILYNLPDNEGSVRGGKQPRIEVYAEWGKTLTWSELLIIEVSSETNP